jgi:hypothetical protein
MTRKKLEKIKREITSARQRSNTFNDLARIAISLERERRDRGKEPAFISKAFPNANPITIPFHSGKDVARGTARNILNQLEEDVGRFEERFDQEGESEDDDDED